MTTTTRTLTRAAVLLAFGLTGAASGAVLAPDMVTASASSEALSVEDTVNRSGITQVLGEDVHGTATSDLWLTSSTDTNPPPFVVWEFNAQYQIGQVKVWNYNQSGLANRGMRHATIETSLDGSSWSVLFSDYELAIGAGNSDMPATDTIDFGDTPAKFVRFTAHPFTGGADSGSWGDPDQVGLSEVEFSGEVAIVEQQVSLTVSNNSFETSYTDGSYQRPTYWTLEDPVNSRITTQASGGANDGSYRLGVAASGPLVDRLYQSIDVSLYAAVVDDGNSTLDVQSYGRNFPNDIAEMWVVCVDAGASELSTSQVAVTADNSSWHALTVTDTPVPTGTRAVQIWLSFDRTVDGGSGTDAYLDGLVTATINLLPNTGTVVIVR